MVRNQAASKRKASYSKAGNVNDIGILVAADGGGIYKANRELLSEILRGRT
jgi:hypothetical protein